MLALLILIVGPLAALRTPVDIFPEIRIPVIAVVWGYTGVGIVKVFFQLGTDINTANAQVTAIAQTVLKQMPPNITPPLNFNASTVPIIQIALARLACGLRCSTATTR